MDERVFKLLIVRIIILIKLDSKIQPVICSGMKITGLEKKELLSIPCAATQGCINPPVEYSWSIVN